MTSTLGRVMRYTLRRCTDGDRAWAYALKSEAYREVVERQFGPWNEEFQRRLFEEHWKPTLSNVVVVDSKAVGLVAVEARGDCLWLREIQVAFGWRGKGIGNAIIRDLIGRAHAGHQPHRLQVLKGNERAQRFYRRHGFRIIGETDTHILMESQVGPNEASESTLLPAALDARKELGPR